MQKEDWKSARETALRAARLQPYDATVLLRLSACYGQEKDYVNAHMYYERALALLSVSERTAYVAKLEHLRTQAADIKNGVYKEDPFEKLPLEIVINIFQLGLEDDPMLALKASWVNQRWRSTIHHNCLELWRTWTVDDQELCGRKWDKRREFWLERAGGSFDAISLGSLSSPAVYQLPDDMQTYAPNVKRVDFKAQTMDILDHFARRGDGSERLVDIESLRLAIVRVRDPWGGSRFRNRPDPSEVITCDLPINIDSLRTLELSDVGFRTYGEATSHEVAEPGMTVYPALTHLTIENCLFPHAYAKTGIDDARGTNVRYQADVLHNTLRGSPQLEHLGIIVSWLNRREGGHGPGHRTLMNNLRTAILPPASVWSIDVMAPNLRSIAFKLLKTVGGYTPGENTGTRQALIPSLEETPVTVETMATLESAEFVCSRADRIAGLEAWISRLPNVAELVIRDIEQFPYPPPYGRYHYLSDRTSNVALQLLVDHPDWCPSLTTLCFESCFTPGRLLVEFVRQRRNSSTSATITKLTLEGCTKLSKKAKTALTREVAEFEIRDEYNVSSKSKMMKQFIDNKFEAIEGVRERF
jgi:hypothetical protein